MSTNYYKLAPPITHIRIDDQNKRHTQVSIWTQHGNSGQLIIETECLGELLRLFAGEPAIHTHAGGKGQGLVVTVLDDTLLDHTVLVSERGELFTVGQIKARDGAGKVNLDKLIEELRHREEE